MVKEKISSICDGSYIFIINSQMQAKKIIEQIINFKKITNDDLINIDADGQSIKIAQIRDIKNKISLKPNGQYQLTIINNAHLMTVEASNALLKILEEPPKFSIIILITSNLHTLLPTIISRCKKIFFTSESEVGDQVYISYFEKLNQAKRNYQKIKLVDEIVKNEIDIRFMLMNWIEHLKSNINEESVQSIKTIYKFEQIYSTNLNQKLFLENLFLTIKI